MKDQTDDVFNGVAGDYYWAHHTNLLAYAGEDFYGPIREALETVFGGLQEMTDLAYFLHEILRDDIQL